jgi:hypothetical protein
MDEWMNGWMMVGWMDGWINEWMDEWMDGWMMGGGVTAENIPNFYWVSGWKKVLIFCFLGPFFLQSVCWYNSHEKF